MYNLLITGSFHKVPKDGGKYEIYRYVHEFLNLFVVIMLDYQNDCSLPLTIALSLESSHENVLSS